MSNPELLALWDASANAPFAPTVGKDSQFFVGFTLLLFALMLTSLFGLNRSIKTLPLYGIPASLAFGFGSVFMICAVGVYVPNTAKMCTTQPLFRAISSSARQIQLLLRCISFSTKAHVRISPEGLRFSTEDGSTMEAAVLLSKDLFTTYTCNTPHDAASEQEEDNIHLPFFQINLDSLLETLNIFALSDPAAAAGKRPGMAGGVDPYDAFASHRLQRHAGINNAFASTAPGIQGLCTFTYAGPGEPLSVHMSEAGVTTTCELTTYEANTSGEEIPFNRDAIALKTIMRSGCLLDAIQELSGMSPSTLTITATPSTRSGPDLSLAASGALGDALVEFASSRAHDAPILETFICYGRTNASFTFGLVKAAQRAMASASKVSLRLDEEGVLSLQFLIQNEEGRSSSEGLTFVDFRIIPLVEGEAEEGGGSDSN
ncbi:hypothetical protein K431DRAFT_339353 [Polychaeton citri CBS 116435]|uniref:Rad1-domain-containing protein n=1 Tax=Polychaeton citri CBS 116435 TaxID=1314669 RepID=A0A9P4Q6Z1_9PEZI|nr:hypothetical protein K431DRAFT_339353 [Polychaeton citri CBS 116435]